MIERTRGEPSTAEIERKTIIGMIVSTKFCTQILPVASPDYFSAPYSQIILEWVQLYFKKYSVAPVGHIQDIFEAERKKLPSERVVLVETFLNSLSDEYEKSENFNAEYLLDESMDFFRERRLRLLSQRVSGCLDTGQLGAAEEEIREYENIARMTSKWEDPFGEEGLKKAFETQGETFFTLPGKLGQVTGNIERGYFIGVFGPMKRGKSWLLGEIGILGILSGLKVAFLSAEMSFAKMAHRFYRRLTGLPVEEGDYACPVFDCGKNQDGSCDKKARENTLTLAAPGEKTPEFDPGLKYKVCTHCRDRHIPGYIPAVWYEVWPKKKIDPASIRKTIRGMKHQRWDKNLRIITYPRFDCSVIDVERDLDTLEFTENFIPDMIITDYADIFRPSHRNLVGREAIDDIWKLHARMASRRHAIVITGSQTTRDSMNAKVTRFTDAAEDIRKLAHIDLGLFLSQTYLEKKRGIQRISVLQRHEASDERKQIQILQQLDLGQVLLDSEWYFKRK